MSLGAGASGTLEIVSMSVGILLGDAINIGIKGYIGVGVSFDLSNGLKIGLGKGWGVEVFVDIDWNELLELIGG